MKQLTTRLDKIIIFCKNIQKTTALYSQALGLKVYLQSQNFVQLKDSNNLSIYLQASTQPSYLLKGYSPMLSFKVEDFQKTFQRLKKYQLLMDGEVSQSEIGKLATFMGMDNELITINNFRAHDQEEILEKDIGQNNMQDDKQAAQIKRLLQKIKM